MCVELDRLCEMVDWVRKFGNSGKNCVFRNVFSNSHRTVHIHTLHRLIRTRSHAQNHELTSPNEQSVDQHRYETTAHATNDDQSGKSACVCGVLVLRQTLWQSDLAEQMRWQVL